MQSFPTTYTEGYSVRKAQIGYTSKVDDNPFSRDPNMVDARLLKGKTKVLTLTRPRETGTVDPKMQISTDKYR